MGKIHTVTLPDIGEGVVEGEVIEWRKQVGDSLQQDEPVVLVMTDKATVELPAPYPGVLARQYYQPGGIAIKDKPLYDIELVESTSTEKPPEKESSDPFKENPLNKIQTPAQEQKISSHSMARFSSGPQKVLAIPKVRKLAKQLGIPLEEIQGSGKEGRVVQEDLGKYMHPSKNEVEAASPWELKGDKEIPLIGIKALMAKKMIQSKSLIPHFSYFEQADVTRLVQLKNNIKENAEEIGIHLTYMPFILRALSLCIRKHPLLNSSFDALESKVILHEKQNMGIAMATALGLIVPVLKNVEEMNIESLIKSYDDLIKRAQKGKLLPSDMKESTLTVSNFGNAHTHGLWATPVINYPEAAILGISRIHQEPAVRNGEVVVRDTLNLSWSFDHRIIDGNTATQISQTLCSLIENPAALL